MRQQNFLRRCFLIFAALANCGCVAIYRTKPIDVQVLDAETGEPIPNAAVHVSHGPSCIDPLWALTLNKPENSETIADADGRATIDVARFGSVFWGASAPGYLHGRNVQFTSRGYVPTKFALQGDSRAVIRLFHGPAPTVSIVVPSGYRGPLLIDRRAVNAVQPDDVFKRKFVLRANERGYVRFDSPLLLEQIAPSSTIPVSYDDGQPIPEEDACLADEALGVRRLTSNYNYDILIVGTKRDAEDLHRVAYEYIDGDPHHVRQNSAAIDTLFSSAAGEPVGMLE